MKPTDIDAPQTQAETNLILWGRGQNTLKWPAGWKNVRTLTVVNATHPSQQVAMLVFEHSDDSAWTALSHQGTLHILPTIWNLPGGTEDSTLHKAMIRTHPETTSPLFFSGGRKIAKASQFRVHGNAFWHHGPNLFDTWEQKHLAKDLLESFVLTHKNTFEKVPQHNAEIAVMSGLPQRNGKHGQPSLVWKPKGGWPSRPMGQSETEQELSRRFSALMVDSRTKHLAEKLVAYGTETETKGTLKSAELAVVKTNDVMALSAHERAEKLRRFQSLLEHTESTKITTKI